jgi:hypothetical protein
MLKLTQTELVLAHAMPPETMGDVKREKLTYFFFYKKQMSCTLDKNSASQLLKKTTVCF